MEIYYPLGVRHVSSYIQNFLKELEKERGQNGKRREGCDRGGRIRNVHKFWIGVIDGESGKQMGKKINLPLVEEKRVCSDLKRKSASHVN